MLSHKHKCIFIHQRKTAGSSIIFDFGLTPEEARWHVGNDGVSSLDPTWDEISRQYKHYFVFAVVRNPWDRFASGWKYLRSTRDKSLIEVLTHLPKEGHDYRHLARPQHITLYDGDNLIADELIRFEDLQAGYDKVCDWIGKPRSQLLTLNKTRHEHYRHYFDNSEARALFEARFSRDIELFGYEF